MHYLLLAFLIFFSGCKDSSLPNIQSNLENPNGNFTLYVSNQSLDIEKVDIHIMIDGQPVVYEYFKVKNQHNRKKWVLKLPEGEHTIVAETSLGEINLKQQFDVKGKQWGVLNFWASEKTVQTEEHPHFSFKISDTPIGFL